jgi:hypothetical protein
MPTGTIVTNVKDVVALVLDVFNTTKREIAFLVPPSFLSLAGSLYTFENAERFIKSGGVVRGITTISRANIEEAQMRLGIGEDLRHSEVLSELFLLVGDKQHSISSMNIGVREYTFDTPVTAFWSENPAYAEYLLLLFENAWSQAVPAKERIRELLRHG